jgi:hypothetical protein
MTTNVKKFIAFALALIAIICLANTVKSFAATPNAIPEDIVNSCDLPSEWYIDTLLISSSYDFETNENDVSNVVIFKNNETTLSCMAEVSEETIAKLNVLENVELDLSYVGPGVNSYIFTADLLGAPTEFVVRNDI